MRGRYDNLEDYNNPKVKRRPLLQRVPNNQDLNPLEVPADKEDKKTADEDVSFGDANGGDENGFGGADVFNNSFGNGESNNFGEPSRQHQQPRHYEIEEEKGVDPFHVASDGDR